MKTSFTKASFRTKITISALIVTIIPLVLSYWLSLHIKLKDNDEIIRNTLQEAAGVVCSNEKIQDELYTKEGVEHIQDYTKNIISIFKDVDIIVISDMSGKKYSHLDEMQIGDIFVGEDKFNVLNDGSSYFSLKEGSMGKTLRWFQPIYYGDTQVGFVMVGKYYKDIRVVNDKIKFIYFLLFITCVSVSGIGSTVFAKKIKKAMLGMEPDEITRLYEEKKILINSVKDGIIAINEQDEVTEVNKICFEMFDEFNFEEIRQKLDVYIRCKFDIEMKEFIIDNKKIFITVKHIMNDKKYLGVIITLTDRNNINKIAKEITGIDEMVKNLRASAHEYKNNLYVLLGLLQLKEYDEATNYILKLEKMQRNNNIKFADIKDSYIRALLISRESVAKERKINFSMTEESFLEENHGIISSFDIITILGNLIENAFEACSDINIKDKNVEVSLFEDDDVIEIQVRDNGKKINPELKEKIFDEGVSSKAEGRGIGLFLIKSRVELYSGKIEIEEFESEKIFVVTVYKGRKK